MDNDEDKDRVNIAQNVRLLREHVPALLELAELNAKLLRAKYLALKAQGFTDVQALELCWRMT